MPNALLLQNVDPIEAEGMNTLTITLKPGFPSTDFLTSLADGHSKVVVKEVVDQNGDLKEGPVIGTGPWVWVRTQRDVESAFERNPDYFEEGLPFADDFIIRIIRDEQTRLAAFAARRVDVYSVSPERWDDLLQETSGDFGSFLARQGGSGLVLAMNVSRPPFDDLNVRKAVLKALDPRNYVRTVWADQDYVSLGMPVRSPGWLLSRDEMRGDYFADPGAAANILNGLRGERISFRLTVADFGDVYLEQGRRIEQDLRSVGFDPRVDVVSSFQYEDQVWRRKDYQMAVGELQPSSTTNSFLFAVLHSMGSWNVVDHSDGKLGALIVEQSLESNSAARGELVRRLQRYLLEQGYLFSPVTGTVGTGARWVFTPRVNGFYPNTAASEYFHWAKTWVEEPG